MRFCSGALDHLRRMSVLALTWMDQRRTQELCAGLNLELVVLKTTQRRMLRYLVLGARTAALLARRRVRVLLVQNPSLVLATLAVLLRSLLGYHLIVDAHNEAVDPYINPQRWIRTLSRWVIRKSDLTIVSNRHLAELVEGCGGRSFTLPDPVPTPPPGVPSALGGPFNVVLIATHARDEPVAQIFEAVRGSDIQLYVTGNPRGLAPALAADLPPNVRLTGFLPDAEYWSLLRSADGIIDLTLMEDCLVSGAYEALAVGTPMLLSKNRASVELFGEAATFTDNTAPDIRRALELLRSGSERLRVAAELKRREMGERWSASARALASVINNQQIPAPR
jgi:glycosyltransferase involved in cell wall biosynthesis